MIFSCCNDNRRSAVLRHPTLNGIDYLEVLDDSTIADLPSQQVLLVHCLKSAPTGLVPDNVLITGGESITGIKAAWVAPALTPPKVCPAGVAAYLTGNKLADADKVLVVFASQAGDFSPYTLSLQQGPSTDDSFHVTNALEGFDPQLSSVQFSFKVDCGPYFDCAPEAVVCAPELPTPPVINYLAKDYGSFRTVMLDRLNQLLPSWGASSEADQGIVLTEVIAYVADQLSYKQDAVTTEAYLMTARSRISLRRHVRLLGYRVHDGANARAFVSVAVAEPMFLDGSITRFFTDAADMPTTPIGHEQAALDAGVLVFEPMQDANLFPEHNQLLFYTWGDNNCCLPQGATEATLLGTYPNLQPGDVLIFQEVLGPQTGAAADAEVRHRYAVRLTSVSTTDIAGAPLVDSLFEQGTGAAIDNASQTPQPVTEIAWSADDALSAPLCISSSFVDDSGKTQSLKNVSVARGNVVLADQGLSMPATPLPPVPVSKLLAPRGSGWDRCKPSPRTSLPVRYRPVLPNGPVTQAVPLPVSGAPVTSSAQRLLPIGALTLKDKNGYSSLSISANDPAGWPRFVGVLPQAGSSPGTFRIDVILRLPAAAGDTVLERFDNLATPADAVAAIAAQSRLLAASVPAGANPPAGFTGNATLLAPSQYVPVTDTNGQTWLELAPSSVSSWPSLFTVIAQSSLTVEGEFNLLLQYDSPFGPVGNVHLPILVQQINNITLATAAASFSGGAALLKVTTFDRQPNPSLSATALLSVNAADAIPEIKLNGILGDVTTTWNASQDLLGDGPADTNFVVEVEANGRATLRFGDGTNGLQPAPNTVFSAMYRVGNGTAGNVGADSLVRFADDPRILSCTNPLPAAGGVDPETSAQIRRRAPASFTVQKRAVTMQDYADVAQQNSQVESAEATLRWTGSWYTVFVTAEPLSGGALSRPLRKTLWQSLQSVRLAGQDLMLLSPDYVSLALTLTVCVDPAYFQTDVQKALQNALSASTATDGQPGIFSSARFKLGQTVYLSQIYAAARAVPGVRSVMATVFQPQSMPSTNSFLDAGEIAVSPTQVARLANDRSLPANGQLTLNMQGGK